jgi:DNA polymerase-3 subunit beta
MKITIDSKQLLHGLEIVKPVITGSIIPVCENVLLNIRQGEIILMGTNTHHSAITTIQCESVEKAKALIPFVDIYNLCKLLPTCPLEITFSKGSIEVMCDTGTYNIQNTDEVKDFPKIDLVDIPTHSVELASSLIETIQQKTLKFIHPDNMATSMHGVAFDFAKGSLTTVALDGCCISVHKIPCNSKGDNFFFVQKKAVELMGVFSFKGEVTLKFDNKRFQIQNKDTVIISNLIDEAFPAYKEAIVINPYNVEIERKVILQSIERAKQFSGVDAAKFIFDKDSIEVLADNHSLGKGFSEKHPLVDSKIEGEVSVGLNIKYLMNALDACKNDVININIKDEKSWVRVTNRDEEDSFIQIGSYSFNN